MARRVNFKNKQRYKKFEKFIADFINENAELISGVTKKQAEMAAIRDEQQFIMKRLMRHNGGSSLNRMQQSVDDILAETGVQLSSDGGGSGDIVGKSVKNKYKDKSKSKNEIRKEITLDLYDMVISQHFSDEKEEAEKNPYVSDDPLELLLILSSYHNLPKVKSSIFADENED